MVRIHISNKKVFLIGIALAVIGILVVSFIAPDVWSKVVAHETVAFGSDPAVIGPISLDEGWYYIWIEDFVPGYDEGEVFTYEVYSEDIDHDARYLPIEYETKTIEGVDCEKLVGYDLRDGDWTFEIDTINSTTRGENIHVFIVDTSYPSASLLFAFGIIVTSFGIIMIIISFKSTKKNDRK